MLITQPKTGTHFLKPILTELTQKQPFRVQAYRNNLEEARSLNFMQSNTYMHLHAPYTQELDRWLAGTGTIAFFVKRDPRDQIVSLLNHYKYIDFLDKKVEKIPNDSDRLLYMIKNQLKIETLNYMGWIYSANCCVLDFSKLMGSHGGAATDLEALLEMRKIASALQVDCSDSYLMDIYLKHFGSGASFFRGKVGSWKDYFHAKHKKAAKKEIGSLLIQLGYEKDYNW